MSTAKQTTSLTEAELEQLRVGLLAKEEAFKKQCANFECQKKEYEKCKANEIRSIEAEKLRMAEERAALARHTEVTGRSIDYDSTRENIAQIREELRRMRAAVTPVEATTSRATAPAEREEESPRISYREATDLVPYFDGSNIPLSQFTQACRRAKEVVPSRCEFNLTKLLINKLRGRAYYAVEDETCGTVTQLIDLLTAAFGHSKTLDQYQGELGSIYLRPKEHIIDYISRVKELRSAILDCYRRQHYEIDNATVVSVNKLVVRSFCEGLPLEYRLQIRASDFGTPQTVFSEAVRIAKRQEIDKQRYHNPSHGILSKPIGYVSGTNSRYDRQHSTSHGRGNGTHMEEGRRVYDYSLKHNSNGMSPMNNNNRSGGNQRPQYVNSRRDNIEGNSSRREVIQSQPNRSDERQKYNNQGFDKSVKWCKYCKNSGHEIEECRKRQYNNTRSGNQLPGNGSGPSREPDRPRAEKLRPTNPVTIVGKDQPESPL